MESKLRWLTVSGVSVHDWVIHWFWALGGAEAAHHDGSAWHSKTTHGLNRTERKRNRSGSQGPIKDTPQRPETSTNPHLFFSFFSGTGAWTQGPTFSHTSSPFCFRLISGRPHNFCWGLASIHNPPTFASHLAGITNMYHHAQLVFEIETY
jgi:hypothetical protein